MPDGTPKKQLDVSRLARIGWEAKIPLSAGLKESYDDFIRRQDTKTLRE